MRSSFRIGFMATGFALSLTALPSAAHAQLVPPLGEPTGPNASSFVSTPLRLSLQGNLFPQASQFPNCASREDAAGNSVNGVPVRRFTLLQLSPNLVLTGFTQLGCPVDSAIGGAASFLLPLGAKSWLVLGAGMYGAPALPASSGLFPGESRTNAVWRADYVWHTSHGNSRSVGFDALKAVGPTNSAGHELVTFTGSF